MVEFVVSTRLNPQKRLDLTCHVIHCPREVGQLATTAAMSFRRSYLLGATMLADWPRIQSLALSPRTTDALRAQGEEL